MLWLFLKNKTFSIYLIIFSDLHWRWSSWLKTFLKTFIIKVLPNSLFLFIEHMENILFNNISNKMFWKTILENIL